MPVPFQFFSQNKKPVASSTADQIILVSGLPRSGTSMMMRILEAGGLPVMTDFQRSADDNNPKGYYEFERVKKLKEGDNAWLDQAGGKVVKVVSALLESLPPVYPYRVIFMRREMAEILASQRRMLERSGKPDDGVSDEKLASIYQRHLEHIQAWLGQQPNIQVLYVNYNEILRAPQPVISRVNSFLGGGLDEAKMAQMIDLDLYRERRA